MTKARGAALAVLQSADSPLSAAGVIAGLGPLCDPVTVYRTLHFLENTGLAESFILNCHEHGTERYYVAKGDHRHWFHCERCHIFIEFDACCVADAVEELANRRGLRLTRHILYFLGLCGRCAAEARSVDSENP